GSESLFLNRLDAIPMIGCNFFQFGTGNIMQFMISLVKAQKLHRKKLGKSGSCMATSEIRVSVAHDDFTSRFEGMKTFNQQVSLLIRVQVMKNIGQDNSVVLSEIKPIYIGSVKFYATRSQDTARRYSNFILVMVHACDPTA